MKVAGQGPTPLDSRGRGPPGHGAVGESLSAAPPALWSLRLLRVRVLCGHFP